MEGTVKEETRTRIEAAVFRRLLEHLDGRKDVQNIELMILAGFCRNCLSKWYAKEAAELGEDVDLEQAREIVYGMPYGQWKARFQAEATPEQLERFKAAQRK
jgi:hypothetical protein